MEQVYIALTGVQMPFDEFFSVKRAPYRCSLALPYWRAAVRRRRNAKRQSRGLSSSRVPTTFAKLLIQDIPRQRHNNRNALVD
jgi:hypothetical protein